MSSATEINAEKVKREKQVLALREEGKTFDQIGDILGVSASRAHVIYRAACVQQQRLTEAKTQTLDPAKLNPMVECPFCKQRKPLRGECRTSWCELHKPFAERINDTLKRYTP